MAASQSVSYTHLDVYKRQGLISAIDTSKLENYASLQESLKEVEDVVDEEGKVYGCLLYTSRCV